MAENSKIAWTTHTFSPWVGCTKISPACDNCYAESWAKRAGNPELWQGSRRRTRPANWQMPIKWNTHAAKTGIRPRVFCASLADVFDNDVPPEWREDLWTLISQTPHLDWQLLTKRIGNAARMLPNQWGAGWPHVWLGSTVVTQEEVDRDVKKLLATPAAVRFLSCEPMIEMLDVSAHLWGKDPACENCPKDLDCECGWKTRKENGQPALDWIICGGESGSHARQMHDVWALDLRQQCKDAGVAFFMKQLSQTAGPRFKEFESFSQSLQVREFPR